MKGRPLLSYVAWGVLEGVMTVAIMSGLGLVSISV